MLYKLIAYGLMASFIGLVVACQPLERPFQPEAKGSLRAAPGPRASLYIAPVENGPDRLSYELAEELQNLGIAAFSGEPQENIYRVTGEIVLQEGKSHVIWTILDPIGRETGLDTAQKIGDIIDGPLLAPADLEKVSLRSASALDILLGGNGVNFEALKKPVLFIPIVANAPGDGSETLSAAMQDQMSKYGIDVLPEKWGATYIVKGEVGMTKPKAGMQIITILWKLERQNGHFVGKIEQKNRIRAGTLNGPWGDVATAAAKGGARGVLKLLKQAEPAYFRNKS